MPSSMTAAQQSARRSRLALSGQWNSKSTVADPQTTPLLVTARSSRSVSPESFSSASSGDSLGALVATPRDLIVTDERHTRVWATQSGYRTVWPTLDTGAVPHSPGILELPSPPPYPPASPNDEASAEVVIFADEQALLDAQLTPEVKNRTHLSQARARRVSVRNPYVTFESMGIAPPTRGFARKAKDIVKGIVGRVRRKLKRKRRTSRSAELADPSYKKWRNNPPGWKLCGNCFIRMPRSEQNIKCEGCRIDEEELKQRLAGAAWI
ncbi:hypothetical protein BT63DRAFT_417673 [Microthyrium microscopicum]|uniref:Uncharacterized protein n=1 Tax=Microthyrium microscopicum TaxID=703497 RepID=A0A6A6U2G8_9PEZI|nr:hypothetical protein BT63DRAFT_417673 [Microthyrium microscopicum]